LDGQTFVNQRQPTNKTKDSMHPIALHKNEEKPYMEKSDIVGFTAKFEIKTNKLKTSFNCSLQAHVFSRTFKVKAEKSQLYWDCLIEPRNA
jgi:hypothetical protein